MSPEPSEHAVIKGSRRGWTYLCVCGSSASKSGPCGDIVGHRSTAVIQNGVIQKGWRS